MMEMECAGSGGSAPLGNLINYIHLYTFMCRQCANDVQMTKMICMGCARCVGIYGDVQMMEVRCEGCGGSAPLGIIYIYILSCAFMYRQRINDEIGVCGKWWKCALRYLFLCVRGLEVRP